MFLGVPNTNLTMSVSLQWSFFCFFGLWQFWSGISSCDRFLRQQNKPAAPFKFDKPASQWMVQWLINLVTICNHGDRFCPLPNALSMAYKQGGDPNHLQVLGWSSNYPPETESKSTCILPSLVGGFSPTHLKNMFVNQDHETPCFGVNMLKCQVCMDGTFFSWSCFGLPFPSKMTGFLR